MASNAMIRWVCVVVKGRMVLTRRFLRGVCDVKITLRRERGAHRGYLSGPASIASQRKHRRGFAEERGHMVCIVPVG